MFFETMNLRRTMDLKSNPMDSSHFKNNFKRTINCPLTWANMNEHRTQTLSLLCNVRYSTMEKLS